VCVWGWGSFPGSGGLRTFCDASCAQPLPVMNVSETFTENVSFVIKNS
jgi:hypothetical protein